MTTMIQSIAFAAIATISSFAFAGGETYTVTATLLHNGKAFGEPSVVVKGDTPASVQVSGPDGYKLWLAVSDLASDKIQVAAKLDSSYGAMEPVLVVSPAKPATVTVGGLGLTVIVVRGGS